MVSIEETAMSVFATLVVSAVFLYVGLSANDNIIGTPFFIGGIVGILGLVAFVLKAVS
jgi:hypothetical protein